VLIVLREGGGSTQQALSTTLQIDPRQGHPRNDRDVTLLLDDWIDGLSTTPDRVLARLRRSWRRRRRRGVPVLAQEDEGAGQRGIAPDAGLGRMSLARLGGRGHAVHVACQWRLVKSQRLHETLSILEPKRGARMTDTSTGRASFVVGGGYGGINAAKALDDVAEVTLVDPPRRSSATSPHGRALVEPDWLRDRSTRQPRSLHT
jgi:hypothetical protein